MRAEAAPSTARRWWEAFLTCFYKSIQSLALCTNAPQLVTGSGRSAATGAGPDRRGPGRGLTPEQESTLQPLNCPFPRPRLVLIPGPCPALSAKPRGCGPPLSALWVPCGLTCEGLAQSRAAEAGKRREPFQEGNGKQEGLQRSRAPGRGRAGSGEVLAAWAR